MEEIRKLALWRSPKNELIQIIDRLESEAEGRKGTKHELQCILELTADNKELKADNKELKIYIEKLRKRYDRRFANIDQLEQEIKNLRGSMDSIIRAHRMAQSNSIWLDG
jgi:hypothetical protein